MCLLKNLQGSPSRTKAKPSVIALQARLAYKCEDGEPQCLLGQVNNAAVMCGLRQQVAVQTPPAMPSYLRARRAGRSAYQADPRPGLKALEQKRKRSAMGEFQVRRQDMEPQG